MHRRERALYHSIFWPERCNTSDTAMCSRRSRICRSAMDRLPPNQQRKRSVPAGLVDDIKSPPASSPTSTGLLLASRLRHLSKAAVYRSSRKWSPQSDVELAATLLKFPLVRRSVPKGDGSLLTPHALHYKLPACATELQIEEPVLGSELFLGGSKPSSPSRPATAGFVLYCVSQY
jgi:hypothetical protein